MRNCNFCGKEFYNVGNQKICSDCKDIEIVLKCSFIDCDNNVILKGKAANDYKLSSGSTGNHYCSNECFGKAQSLKKYMKYLKDNSVAYGQKNMQNFKKYFLKEQDYKCAICGLKNYWNGKKLVFVLDHIDGDANNNTRKNLRLICPNCDSQLDTFKSKNKVSSRRNW